MSIICHGAMVTLEPKHPQEDSPPRASGTSTARNTEKIPPRAIQPRRGTVSTRPTTANSAAMARRKVSNLPKGECSTTG